MAPIAVISSRQSPTAHAATFSITAGAIVGILLGSVLGIVALCVCAYLAKKCCSYAQALERSLRGDISATRRADIGVKIDGSSHPGGYMAGGGSRDGPYEKAVLVSEWLKNKAPHKPTINEHYLHRSQRASDDHLMSQSFGSDATLRSGRHSGANHEAAEFQSDNLALSNVGIPGHDRLLVRPAKAASAVRIRPPPTRFGNTYEASDFDALQMPDDSSHVLHRSHSRTQNRHMTVRGRAASSPEAAARRLKILKSQQGSKKGESLRWSDGGAVKSPVAEPALVADPGRRPSRVDMISRAPRRRPLEEIEREIAKLKRTDITRRAEMELEGRRTSLSAAGNDAKERSRVEQWIRNTAWPTLHHVPIGDGSEYLSDITTSSALEFPRWGESEASVLAPQSVALSFDPWRDEVLKNKVMRRAF